MIPMKRVLTAVVLAVCVLLVAGEVHADDLPPYLHMDENGNLLEKGFGYSLWRSISKLETWAESHHTHLQIFVTFNRLAKKFKELTLYHEVSVFDAANQYFEYINCHPTTGILRAV